MFKVKYDDLEVEAVDLDSAMSIARGLGCFVTIVGHDMEFCGMFGASIITDNVLPDGTNYEWKKRRE